MDNSTSFINLHWLSHIDEVEKALLCKLHLKSRVYVLLKGELKDCFQSTSETETTGRT